MTTHKIYTIIKNSLLAILLFCMGCSGNNLVQECEGNLGVSCSVLDMTTSYAQYLIDKRTRKRPHERIYYQNSLKLDELSKSKKEFSKKLFREFLDSAISYLPPEDSIIFFNKMETDKEVYIKTALCINRFEFNCLLVKFIRNYHSCWEYITFKPILFEYNAPYLTSYEIIPPRFDSSSITVSTNTHFRILPNSDFGTKKLLQLSKKTHVQGVRIMRAKVNDLNNKKARVVYNLKTNAGIKTYDYTEDLSHYAK